MQDEPDARRLEDLERQVRRMQWALRAGGSLAAVLVLAALAARDQGQRADEILRGRGLVIVDSAGAERIVLGAPVILRKVSDRVHQQASSSMTPTDSSASGLG
jgi:hypothetical protein